MTGTVYIKTYTAPEYDLKEILRYAGAQESSPELLKLVQDCIDEVYEKLSYKVCYREFSISEHGEYLDLGFTKTTSSNLRKNLKECDSIVLFAATVGIALDRHIARESRLSPAKALILQAIGSERIESLCNAFNRDISEANALLNRSTAPRFSPGYGDLPLEMQEDIFRTLDCPRKIGLVLNSSLLMSPSKSVTAIIGIGRESKIKDS